MRLRLLLVATALGLAAAVLVGVPAAEARTLHVGPGRALETPSAAAAVARNGDTVEIDAGTYTGDAATWTQDDLTLVGVGGVAHLKAAGADAQGKAIWVLAGDRTRVQNIEFSGAAVPDGNGAGIRAEGAGLTVVHCSFHDNENGILAGANAASDIEIRRSRFAHNGAGDGFTHNLYIGAVRFLYVKGSLFAGADGGHEIKSRALRTTITASRIIDLDSTASYSIDLPNGGDAKITGNVVEQGPNSPNRTLVSYGAEGLTNPTTRLWVVNNTFANAQDSGTVLALAAGTTGAHLRNNLLVGRGTWVSGPTAERRANKRTSRGFRDPAHHDYRLRQGSPAINRGAFVPASRRPHYEYRHPQRYVDRPKRGRVDLGAFEYAG
ncbi:choice-of-anchor Q domain-containing protein [Nocardioides sp.]|uniref:choice-of-anchor Q domain-containing protein n=1 Tax=Nocardioides sp. TaxID=35761 RepID=UPI0035274A9C